MKCKNKNIISLIIAAVFMCNFMPINAVAPSSGSVIIHKYEVDSLKTLGNSAGSGEQIDESNIPESAKMMPNVKYTIAKLVPRDGKYDIDSVADPNFMMQEKVTNSDGIAVFDNLPLGVYRIKEVLPEGYTSLTNEFLVSIPMKTDKGKDNYNVHVYPKSSKEERVQKERATLSEVAGVGDNVSWKINFIVNDDISRINDTGITEYARDFFITDALDERLDYQEKNAKLVAYDGTGKMMENISLKEGIDYLETYIDHTIKWLYTDVGVRKLADYKVRYVEVSFDTVINKKALGTVNMIANGANVDYINASGDPYRFELIENGQILENDARIPRVYLGRVIVDVSDKNTNDKLSGGKYILLSGSELADYKLSLKYPEGTPIVITDENGRAEFTALSPGIYYLVEIESPDGYMKEPIEIKVVIGKTKNEGTVTVSILKELPSEYNDSSVDTGDKQQMIILINTIAILITLMAFYLLIRKRKEEENNN